MTPPAEQLSFFLGAKRHHAIVRLKSDVDILKDAPHRTKESSEICCVTNAETDFGRPFDMHALRRAFPARWGEFVRRHFRNVTDVAVFFDVEDRTARYWWEGRHAPAAPFVLRAVTAFPHAAAFLARAA